MYLPKINSQLFSHLSDRSGIISKSSIFSLSSLFLGLFSKFEKNYMRCDMNLNVLRFECGAIGSARLIMVNVCCRCQNCV